MIRTWTAVGLAVALAVIALASPSAAAEPREVREGACPPSAVGPSPFTDATPDETVFAFEIACMAEAAVAAGSGGDFFPGAVLTRGQSMSLLYRTTYAGQEPPVVPAADFFQDDNDSVHEGAINWARSAGVANGYSDGSFRPGEPVRRDQFAAFAARAHQAVGYSFPASQDAFADDDASVHEPAVNQVAAAGIMVGTGPGTFSPDRSVTRGQATAVMARLADLQIEQGRQGWPLPANQHYTVDPPGQQMRDQDSAETTIALTVSGLEPGRGYDIVLAVPEDVVGNPPETGPARFADADNDRAADLREPEAFLALVNGQPVDPTATAQGVADSDGRLTVTVDNEEPNSAVLVVHGSDPTAPGLQVDESGTATESFGVSGDLVWYVQATPAPTQ